MKIAVLYLVCLCCGVALTQAPPKMAERLEMVWGKYEEFKRNCTAEMGEVSAEEGDYDDWETEDGKCVLACILKEASILNGEAFSRHVMDVIASFVFQDEPELKSLAHRVHLSCEKKLAAAKLTDECDIAVRIHLCLQRGWKQAGFKHRSSKWRASTQLPENAGN